MAKSSSKSSVSNLLRLSGLLYTAGGSFHVMRYFTGWDFRVGEFELTRLGSLIIGSLLLLLAFSCFMASRK